jgi:hypothetical protein
MSMQLRRLGQLSVISATQMLGKLTIAALCSRGCYAGGIVAFVGVGGGGWILLMSVQEFVLLARVTIPVKHLTFVMRIN